MTKKRKAKKGAIVRSPRPKSKEIDIFDDPLEVRGVFDFDSDTIGLGMRNSQVDAQVQIRGAIGFLFDNLL